MPQAHSAYCAPGQNSSYLSPGTRWSKKGFGLPIFLLRAWPGRSCSVSPSYPWSLRFWGGGGLKFPSSLFNPFGVCWKSMKPEGPHPSCGTVQRKMQGWSLSSVRVIVTMNPLGSSRDMTSPANSTSMVSLGVFGLGGLLVFDRGTGKDHLTFCHFHGIGCLFQVQGPW